MTALDMPPFVVFLRGVLCCDEGGDSVLTGLAITCSRYDDAGLSNLSFELGGGVPTSRIFCDVVDLRVRVRVG